jgi:hypothetical protein
LKLLYAKLGREPPAKAQALELGLTRKNLRACQQLAARDAARPCPLLLSTTPHRRPRLTSPPCSALFSPPPRLSPSFYSCAVCVRARSLRLRDLSPATPKPTRLDPSGILRTDRPGLRVLFQYRCAYLHSISYTAVLSPVLRADSSSAASASCSSHPLRPSSPSHTYLLANFTDRTCLVAIHAAGLAFDLAHITLCIVHTASIHPRHHRDSLDQPHPADPSHLAHIQATTPVPAYTYTYDATAK